MYEEDTYYVEGENIRIVSDKTLTHKLVLHGYPKSKAKLIGGFCYPDTKEIFIRESRKDDIKLRNHERGHLMGFKHTLYPTIMASSWVYRWFNVFYPQL